MASKRKQIRQAVASLLKTPAISGLGNVFSNRIEAYEQSELPAASVFAAIEDPRPRDTSNSRYIRTLNLIVEVVVEANKDLDDKLDDWSDVIEERILTNQELGGLATGITYTGTELVLEGESAQESVGTARINFEIQYIK